MRIGVLRGVILPFTLVAAMVGCKIQRPATLSSSTETAKVGVGPVPLIPDAAERETVYVARVIDGDTVELGDRRLVRLAGIDAPESKHPGKPIECMAFEAGRFLREQVEHREVELVLDKQRQDKYRRVVGHIVLAGRYVNAELVERGLAIVYRARRSDRDAILDAAEKRAQSKHLGLWSSHCRGQGN